MASWSEDDFSCSICLDVFNSPLSTPCGHNFCRTCITTFWDEQVQYKCPFCNKLFHSRPDLQVNTFISGMVDQFRSSVPVKEPPCVESGEVPCDICTDPQRKAVKSCLTCFMSYCHTHLEPHQRVARLKTHLLVNAMDCLEDRMCKKHDRLLELFCQTEQVCVCLFCTEGVHKSHPVVPLKEEYEVKTAQLGKIEAEVQQMIQERQRMIQEIKDTVGRSKADADREIADVVQVLNALRRSVEKCQDDLNRAVKERLKSTEKQAKDLIQELEREIEDLTNRRSEVKQLSHTEDHFHLLQTFRSLKDPPPTRDWTTVEVRPPSYAGTLKRSLDQLEETLNMEMKKLPDLKPDVKKSAGAAAAVAGAAAAGAAVAGAAVAGAPAVAAGAAAAGVAAAVPPGPVPGPGAVSPTQLSPAQLSPAQLSPAQLSPAQLSQGLEQLLKGKADNRSILDWVEANLDEQQASSNAFVRTLMTLVCRSALNKSPNKVDAGQMLRLAGVLRKYLNTEQKQLQALYALQALVVELGQPAYLLRRFFDALYDQNVIHKVVFEKWELSMDPAEQQGKGVALKSVTVFFTRLRIATFAWDNS